MYNGFKFIQNYTAMSKKDHTVTVVNLVLSLSDPLFSWLYVVSNPLAKQGKKLK